MNDTRNKWIDVLKFIGIFEIYLGHYGANAGYSYVFAFTHHVALFFFVSGYLENYNKDGMIKTVVKRFKGIMIPFYFFGLLSIIYFTIQNNLPGNLIADSCIELIKGATRNHFIAGSLWFLSALFIVEVMFQVIKKVKFKCLMLLFGLISYFITQNVLTNNPIVKPTWYYNVDSALYFIFFYIAGFVSFKFINAILEFDFTYKKIIYIAMFVLSFAYSTLVFFRKDISRYFNSRIAYECFGIIRPMIIICFFICVAYMLKDIKYLGQLGRNTLYMCGSENIIKSIVPQALGLIGLSYTVNTPVRSILMSLILLIIVDKFFVVWEKYIINKVTGLRKTIFS